MGKRNADTEFAASAANTSPAKRIKIEHSDGDTKTPPVAGGDESPACCGGQEFALRRDLVDGAVLTDLAQKRWRVGKPIGKGSFGEIFLASDDLTAPVSSARAEYVVKIEPHSNGPLFVEIHCLINAGKPLPPATRLPPGMPAYIASGSHYFNASRYRFLILRRYQCDLRALVEQRQLDAKALLCVAVQIVDVLEHLHDRGYAHSDIKAENLMLGACTYEKRQQRAVDVGRVKRVEQELQEVLKKASATDGRTDSAEPAESQDTAEEPTKPSKPAKKTSRKSSAKREPSSAPETADSVASDDVDDTNSSDYQTPRKNGKTAAHPHHPANVEFSGSNPLRACRRGTANGAHNTYADMLSSHYLRPTRKIIDYGQQNSDDDDDSTDDLRPSRNSEARADKDFVPSSSAAGKSPRSSATAAAAKAENGGGRPTRGVGRPRKLLQKLRLTDDAPEETNGGEPPTPPPVELITEDRIHLIDFGLAIKFVDSAGQHRPFCMDARRAHDGTLEFTSRDAHMGAHSRRSDLECFGYNLLYWTQGWLPWKEDVRCMQQPEQVHRIKELFMTDVTVMFRHIYGREVPVWIGQFMRYVGTLAYHDRPDYELCRNVFRAELRKLGVDVARPAEMRLETAELRRRPVLKWPVAADDVKGEVVDGVDGQGAENVPGGMLTPAGHFGGVDMQRSMMKLGLLLAPNSLPFREVSSAGPNRISPKNLRSKSEKVPKGKQRNGAGGGGGQSAAATTATESVFSWTEILSTDPDQIARQRAEKEFDRDPVDTPLCQRYKGKPTYAILEVQNRLKFKDKLCSLDETPISNGHQHRSSTTTAAAPSAQTSAAHKRQQTSSSRTSSTSAVETPTAHFAAVRAASNTEPAAASAAAASMVSPERRKPGLRTAVRHTPKSKAYRDSMLTKQRQRAANKRNSLAVPHSEFSTSADEESSLSSTSSMATATTTCSSRTSRLKRASKKQKAAAAVAVASSTVSLEMSDDDDEDEEEEIEDVDDQDEEDEEEEEEEEAHVELHHHRGRHHHHQHRHHHIDDVDDDVEDDDETSRDTIDYSPIKTRRRRNNAAQSAKTTSRRSKLASVSEEPPAVMHVIAPVSSVMQRKAAVRATQQMALNRDASRHCKY